MLQRMRLTMAHGNVHSKVPPKICTGVPPVSFASADVKDRHEHLDGKALNTREHLKMTTI